MTLRHFFAVAFLSAATALVAGCNGADRSATPAFAPVAPAAQPHRNARKRHHLVPVCQGSAKTCLRHVVIIVQENRTFNNIFAGNGGFPGATTTTQGTESNNGNPKVINLTARQFSAETLSDPDHSFPMSLTAWDGPQTGFQGATGAMDGFDQNYATRGAYTYAYLKYSDVKPYWDMARQYTLADQMFPTEFGPSFSAHLNLVAGSSQIQTSPHLAVAGLPPQYPWGCDELPFANVAVVDTSRTMHSGADGVPPCFSDSQLQTLADTMDANAVSWAYYAPPVVGRSGDDGQLWSIFDAIKYVRNGVDWQRNVLSPPTKVITAAHNFQEYVIFGDSFPNVSWVVPDYVNSDHAQSCYQSGLGCSCPDGSYPCTSDTGPSWVASVVNAIGSQPDLWASTAIVVVWDDWGGWYDPVSPPQLDYRGLGIRVPCIIISPYAKAGYVSHTQYEFGSILKFVENVFSLPSLGGGFAGYTDDTHAGSPVHGIGDAFDFTQAPIPFQPIAAPYAEQFFMSQTPSHRPPDRY